MDKNSMVGKEDVGLPSNIITLQKGEDQNAYLKSKGDFGRRPHPPAQYEIVSDRGEHFGPYPSRDAAKRAGEKKWPDQYPMNLEDEPPTGWLVQVVGADVVRR